MRLCAATKSEMSPSFNFNENRILRFLSLETFIYPIIYILCKCLLSICTGYPDRLSPVSIKAFCVFHNLFFIFSLFPSFLSSPQPNPTISLPELLFILKSIFNYGAQLSDPASFRRRVRTYVGYLNLVISYSVVGSVSIVCICCNSEDFSGRRVVGLGLRGFLFGLYYGIHCVYYQRWVLEFPIIQRDRFRRFKMGFPSAVGQALKLSTVNFLCSALLVILLPSLILIPGEMWRFVVEHFIFYVGSSAVALCWEISYLLCQVMYAKRYIFAPRSKAANPSPPLFRALEESSPRSLRQYLAYLDLCMVCENNADVWRRDFFFESTGSYERVVAASLRPLEQLTSELADGLKGSPSMDRTDKKIFRKFRSPTDTWMDKKLQEAFKDFQLCVWCVRAVAALTECSRKNPRYSYVVDNSACSTTIVPSLLSCLLAVEACMWKKINLQQSPHFIPRRRDDLGNKSGGYLHAKAYAMADVLRTSVYSILSAYHSTETTRMDREIVDLYWPRRTQDGALRDPLYGTHYMLQEKLGLFLEHQA